MQANNNRDTQSANPASLESKVQNQDAKTGKLYHDILALSRVSAAVSGLRDLDAILNVALDSVLRIMNGTVGGILLIDEQTQTLSYRVYRGLSDKYAQEMRLKMGEGSLAGWHKVRSLFCSRTSLPTPGLPHLTS